MNNKNIFPTNKQSIYFITNHLRINIFHYAILGFAIITFLSFIKNNSKSFLKNHPNKKQFLYAFKISFVSISINLALFKISQILGNHSKIYNLHINFFNTKIDLLSNINFWFLVCAMNSISFYICQKQFKNYKIKLDVENSGSSKKQKEQLLKESITHQSSKEIIIEFFLGLLKDFCWAIIISINSLSKNRSHKQQIISYCILIICCAFLHFKNFLSAKNLFDPLIQKTNTTPSNKKDQSNNEHIEILDGMLKMFFVIFASSSNKHLSGISGIKFSIYLIVLISTSIILAIPAFFIRKIAAEYFMQFSHLLVNKGFYLNNKFVTLINNHNAMFMVCAFDCIILIISTIFLYFSLVFFVELSIFFSNNPKLKEIKNSIFKKESNNNQKVSLTKRCVMIIHSFISSCAISLFFTSCFHIITQIQKSILQYNHFEIESLIRIGMILVIILTLSIISQVELYNILIRGDNQKNNNINLNTIEINQDLQQSLRSLCGSGCGCSNNCSCEGCCSNDKKIDKLNEYFSILLDIINQNKNQIIQNDLKQFLDKRFNQYFDHENNIFFQDKIEEFQIQINNQINQLTILKNQRNNKNNTQNNSDGRCPCGKISNSLVHLLFPFIKTYEKLFNFFIRKDINLSDIQEISNKNNILQHNSI